MRVFLTGATGFIGSHIIPELKDAGHTVLGLTRSQAGAQALAAAGADAHHGDLTDLDSLRAGATACDAVIHCAFQHDFSKFAENAQIDERAIRALGSALAGSDRPLIVSGGVGPWSPGRPMTEDVDPPADSPTPRVSEQAAMSLIPDGVSPAVVRLPQVHDPLKQGLVTMLIGMAREKGVSAYVGDGTSRWAAAHILDVARLYRLALEKHQTGAKYHAVGEEGVTQKEIAEAIGRGLKIPVVSLSQEESFAHFGFFAMFAGLDNPASSALTQERLGWRPTGPGLIADIDRLEWVAA
jgi:nucleoside-diphosphate-sugar epimerase